MTSPLIARPYQEIAQSLVKSNWSVVTSAKVRVGVAEWVEYTKDATYDAAVFWFVLMSVKRPAPIPVHHVPSIVKTVAYTAIVLKNVESYVFLALRNVRGSVSITNAPSCVVSHVTGQDVMSPAGKF